MSESENNDILESALAYAARGWPIFPVRQNKTPLTVRGLRDATTDERTIRAWWTRYPDANVAIVTGLDETFDVIDIDPRHGGDMSVEMLVAKHGALPDTLESRTGGGGRHLFFKHVAGFRNSANQVGKGIDTRGEGGYIVAPPSIHQSGALYEWEGADPDQPIIDMPDFLRPGNAGNLQIENLDVGKNQSMSYTAGPGKATGDPVEEGGRNVAAASLAGQYLRQGMGLHEVMRALDGWNETNNPPLAEPELKKTVASVARTHMRNNPAFPVPVVSTATPVEVEMLEQSEDDLPRRELQPAADLKKFPADLLEPPGFVGEIVRWINQTAIMPQPVLALANTLAFFGAIVGRKVATGKPFADLRTNLYCLGVGASGCGKDHSRKSIKRICDAAGLTDKVLGGEDASSDSAIFGATFERKSLLFLWDEIGHMIANVTSRYAQTHQRAIAPLLTRLFSSANTTFLGKEFANRVDARKDIDQPCVCIYGTTVPDRLYGGLTPGEISDGFLGRMLVFVSDEAEPCEQDTEPVPVPKPIIEMVQAWHDRKDLPKAEGNWAAITTHLPIIVSFEPEAVAEIKRFRARCKGHKAANRGTGLDALWARAVEHAAKVALVIACGVEFGSPIISGQIAAYSVKLVEHLIGALVTTVGNTIAASDWERDLLSVKKIIDASGHNGTSLREVGRKLRRLAPKLRTDILNELVNSGDIEVFTRKGKAGVAAKIYISSANIQFKNPE